MRVPDPNAYPYGGNDPPVPALPAAPGGAE